MKVETLEQFYLEELRDLYDAEKQILKALPRMAKAASHEELKSALEEHVQQTEEQAGRLEEILRKRGGNARGRKCKAMVGLIEEGTDFMKEKPVPDIMDVGLITTAQKVEHYEIAGYGCSTTYAKILGFKDDAETLHRTLTEEKQTDDKLTKLAKRIVNPEAKATVGDGQRQPKRGTATSARGAGGRTAERGAKHSRTSQPARRPSRGGRSENGEGAAQSTKDLEVIKAWAEARGGQPAHVCGTGSGEDPGMLRIDFPGYSGADSLEHISWDEWYKKFQDNNLTFLYQAKTKGGKESRFFKLVCMEGVKA